MVAGGRGGKDLNKGVIFVKSANYMGSSWRLELLVVNCRMWEGTELFFGSPKTFSAGKFANCKKISSSSSSTWLADCFLRSVQAKRV